MSLIERLDLDLDIFFNSSHFAESAIFTHIDGSTQEILVLPAFKEDWARVVSGIGSGQFLDGAFLLRYDVGFRPLIHEKITHKSVVWTIRNVQPSEDGRIYNCKVTSNERAIL